MVESWEFFYKKNKKKIRKERQREIGDGRTLCEVKVNNGYGRNYHFVMV